MHHVHMARHSRMLLTVSHLVPPRLSIATVGETDGVVIAGVPAARGCWRRGAQGRVLGICYRRRGPQNIGGYTLSTLQPSSSKSMKQAWPSIFVFHAYFPICRERNKIWEDLTVLLTGLLAVAKQRRAFLGHALASFVMMASW